MTLSDFRRITDELLSAYIDDEVTEQERALIEAAIAQDEEIAWRLNSLRQTVTLLHDLPDLALPRSFALTLDQVAQATEQMVGVGAMERQPVAQESGMRPAAPPRLQRQVAPTPEAGFWQQVAEGWRRFWQGGNPMLRNAAAVSFALMLFLAGGGQLLNRALTQPAGMMATTGGAPAAAPAASEAMPQTQAVAMVPTATEAASLQVQDDSSLKAPVEDAPAEEEESARVMQAPAEGASDAPQATTEQTTEAASAASSETASGESVVAESATADTTEEEDGDAPAPTATMEEPSVAAAMAAPVEPQGDAMPPLAPNPLPGGGSGARPESGGGMGGGGPEGPMGGETGNLVPEEAYGFDVNPGGGPTPLPAEEAVVASVAAAPAEASAASAADVAVTPAVDEVPEEEVAAASVASESVTSESVASDVAATEMPATDAAATVTAAPTAQAVAEAPTETVDETVTEPPAEETPEAVVLVAPGSITSSEIVENVETEGATPATGAAGNVPVVWVAQGTAFLLTIVLASLWWRSRIPRRPRG